MEDYKKKYEDALNAARKFKNDCPSFWDTESNPFRGVFEELKENEDVRNIQDIDSVLLYDKNLPEDTRIRLRNWLKSLRERLLRGDTCSWKPSDEQIEALLKLEEMHVLEHEKTRKTPICIWLLKVLGNCY